MNYWQQSNENIYVAAHRGFSERYPENTMIAFREAAKLGVDQIETDVRVTADGELVLMHDATVDRTTNGHGRVSQMTLAELKTLDAGIKKGEQFAGEKIPTFIEFMDFVKTIPEMTIDIELKEYPETGREALAYEVCDRILRIVEEYDFTDRCVINSFSGLLHEYILKKYGSRYRQHVFYPIREMGVGMKLNPYSYAYCCCVSMDSKSSFDFVRSYGVGAWAGASVRDEETVERAIRYGAELITCNNPDEVLRILREKNRHR